MTNVMEAGKVIREIQVKSKSPVKSPQGEFEALLNQETEALNTDKAEEGKPEGKDLAADLENEAEEADQEINHGESDENGGEMMQLSYLIQANPLLQIKNSVTSLKSSGETMPTDTLLTGAGNLKSQVTPANQGMMESADAPETVKAEAASAFKAETSASVQVQNALPQELKETETHEALDVTETELIDTQSEKLGKSKASIPEEKRHELEHQKIQGNPLESKAAPKTEESQLKSNLLSPFGEGKENEAMSDTEKKPQSDRIENFPSVVTAGEIQKPESPSSPEGTKVESENLELATKEILHQMETLTDGEKTMVKVRLNPKELGEMEISLSMEEGRLTGKIVVGNKEIQQIFTDKLHELNQTLKENRIDVASFEVKLSPGEHQNQEQARHQGRRAMDYPNGFNSQGNGSAQTEERRRPVSPSERGIDILA